MVFTASVYVGACVALITVMFFITVKSTHTAASSIRLTIESDLTEWNIETACDRKSDESLSKMVVPGLPGAGVHRASCLRLD